MKGYNAWWTQQPQTNFLTKIRSYRQDRDDSSSVKNKVFGNENNKEKLLKKILDRY